MTGFALEVAARTVWAEARGEGEAGMRAVAGVLVNRLRARRWGSTLATVCLARMQFSCWNDSDPERPLIAALADDDAVVTACRAYVLDALAGPVDPVGGATHYHAVSIAPPAWTKLASRVAQIGRHVFYANVP